MVVVVVAVDSDLELVGTHQSRGDGGRLGLLDVADSLLMTAVLAFLTC